MTVVPVNVNQPTQATLKSSISICFELKSRYKMAQNDCNEMKRMKDESKFRKDFDDFSKMIPNAKGKLIVVGYKGIDSEIIDFVCTVGSLRAMFKASLVKKDGVALSRYKWYKSLLYNNKYSKLKIQMVS
jgi:hypothetical protein